MVTMHDVPAEALLEALADHLREEIEAPGWAAVAKTGADKELPPEQDDFWYVRAASLLRKVAKDGPVGVERLATEYGDAKRGSNRYRVGPRHRTDASRNIIRTILQDLEDAGYVEEAPGDQGRIVSPAGRSLLDRTAGEVLDDLERPELERYR